MVEESPDAQLRRFSVLADVWRERHRQVSAEGFTVEHDDHHDARELAAAAACYAQAAFVATAEPPDLWPWEDHWWKPRSPRENLVRAAALIFAEIERIDRAEEHKEVAT